MLQNFTISSPTTLVFGKDAELQVGELVKQYADKCLIHHDGGAYLESLLNRVRKSLSDAGVEIVELGGVEPNPKLSLMRKGMQMCKEQNIGFVLAIGGGSVMDSAKFIAIGAGYDGDVWNYDGSYVEGALPHGCICTPVSYTHLHDVSCTKCIHYYFCHDRAADCVLYAAPPFSL